MQDFLETQPSSSHIEYGIILAQIVIAVMIGAAFIG